MAETTPGSDVVAFDPSKSAFPALFSQDGAGSISAILEDNFGEDGFSVSDLDRIHVPAGGGTTWEIPDEDPARTVEGVIVHKQPTRAFWFKARGEGGEDDAPPDCYSPDGKVGVGVFGPGSENNPTGLCSDCPMNVFGSSDRGSGNGKACKEQMQVFLLQPGAVLPLQVSLPPTSLRGFRKYMTRLASKGKSFYAVVSRFGLEVEKGGGQTYSVVVPGKASDLNPEEAQAARVYGATIREFLTAAAAERAAAERQAEEAPPAATSDGGDVWRSDEESKPAKATAAK